jgi:hypothetical protein
VNSDGKYASERWLTKERIIAALIVSAWIWKAFLTGGVPLAIRAGLFFMIPLSFVLIPELMARIAGVASKESLQPDMMTSSTILKWIGWLLILSVPLIWFLF